MKSKKIKVLGVVFLFLVLIFTLNFFAPSAFGRVTHMLGKPFFGVTNAFMDRISTIGGYFRFKGSLIEENKKLIIESKDLKAGLLKLNSLITENEELKAELGRTSSKGNILAYVLESPSFSPYDTFLLDVGREDRVVEGDKISIGGGLGVGYIKEVFPHTSLARLYSSSGEEIEVVVPPTHLLIKATGRGGGNFEIKLPKDIEIKKGTLISLPGIDNEIVGIVETIETDPTQSAQAVYFRSLFNVNQIEKVYIKK